MGGTGGDAADRVRCARAGLAVLASNSQTRKIFAGGRAWLPGRLGRPSLPRPEAAAGGIIPRNVRLALRGALKDGKIVGRRGGRCQPRTRSPRCSSRRAGGRGPWWQKPTYIFGRPEPPDRSSSPARRRRVGRSHSESRTRASTRQSRVSLQRSATGRQPYQDGTGSVRRRRSCQGRRDVAVRRPRDGAGAAGRSPGASCSWSVSCRASRCGANDRARAESGRARHVEAATPHRRSTHFRMCVLSSRLAEYVRSTAARRSTPTCSRSAGDSSRLCDSSAAPVVLHGDLHYGNVLRSRARWLARHRSQSLIERPCYEVAIWLRIVSTIFKGARMRGSDAAGVEMLADPHGFDRERVRLWVCSSVAVRDLVPEERRASASTWRGGAAPSRRSVRWLNDLRRATRIAAAEADIRIARARQETGDEADDERETHRGKRECEVDDEDLRGVRLRFRLRITSSMARPPKDPERETDDAGRRDRPGRPPPGTASGYRVVMRRPPS